MRVFVRLAPALVLALAGCADPSEDHPELAQTEDASEEVGPATYGLALDDDSTVVASFDAPDGRQIKFLEPEPGFVAILVAGRIGSVPLASSEEMSTPKPDQLYERLSGRKAPSKLVAMSRRNEDLRSQPGRTTPSTQTEDGVENRIGVSSQALHNFDDSWLIAGGTVACLFGHQIVRGSVIDRDLIDFDTRTGGSATVYNTGVEARVTGSFKYRNSFTWSSAVNYSLDPNHFVDYFISNNGLNVRYDIKTHINANGSSYTACQDVN